MSSASSASRRRRPAPRPRSWSAFLDYHRDTLRIKTDGLDAAQLDQRLEPSTMTLGGMLKHLAYVEDWWFNQVFAGNPDPEPWASVDWKADDDWDWHSAAEDTPEELRALLDETIAISDRIVAEALARPEGLEALLSAQREPPAARRALQPALDPRAHGRGVRPPQRPRRPHPRVHRRPVGRGSTATGRAS